MGKIGLFDKLGLIKSILGGNQQSLTQSLLKFMPMYGEPPNKSTANWIQTYNLNPRMNPVHQISSDVASTNFELYFKGNEDALENHPAIELLKNPCPDITISRHTLFYITMVYLLLPCGEAFWIKERNGAKLTTELWPLPPNWVLKTPSKAESFFWIQPMGNVNLQPVPVYPQDMIYFKKADVTNPYLRGMGRVNAIGDEVETDEYMAKFNKKYFYNNAMPNMVGMMPGADTKNIERAEESWTQKYGGYNNAHKMAWLGWDAKIQILKETTKEMDFVESRKYLRDAANQHFSIPPEIFGILENSNRSTIDAAYYLYTKNVLRKELNFIAEVITTQLLAEFDKNLYLEFDNVVPEDSEFELKKANDGLKNGTMSLDEWRVANGLDELPSGKGNIIYIPNGFTPVPLDGGTIPEEISASKPVPIMPTANQNTEEETQDTEDNMQEEEPPKKSKALSSDERVKIWDTFDKAAIKGEKEFEKAMRDFFSRQEELVLSSYEKATGGIRQKQDKYIDWEEEDRILLATMTPLWRKSFMQGYLTANNLYNFGVGENLINPRFLDWVKEFGAEQVKGINGVTKSNIQRVIDESIEAGDGIPETARRIKEVFATAKTSRARTIARTETHNSVGVGTFETYKEAGVEKKEWLATDDGRTRESHADINREVVDINGVFSNGLEFPGDPSGPPEEIINCRCTLLSVIND